MAKTPVKQVRVRVKGGVNPKSREVEGQPLFEDGAIHQPGSEFIISAERAEALGDHVIVLGEIAAPAAPATTPAAAVK